MPVTILIIAGGDPPTAEVVRSLEKPDLVICADRGLNHAQALGIAVDVAIGDFDSVDPASLAAAEAAEVKIESFSPDKDKTDLELALHRACDWSPAHVVVVGIGGGRFDHLFGNLLTLASEQFRELEIEALVGTALVTVIHSAAKLHGSVGELVSLFAMHRNAQGVCIAGMQYNVDDATLNSGSSKGLSNQLVEPVANVSVVDGVLLAIQPDRLLDTSESGVA